MDGSHYSRYIVHWRCLVTWYNVLDYNVSFHETDTIYIWLHIGSIKFVEGYNKVEVNKKSEVDALGRCVCVTHR